MNKRLENIILVLVYILVSMGGGAFLAAVALYYHVNTAVSWLIGTVSAIILSAMVLNYRIMQLEGKQ
jgi:hypothetical protein